jgi:hypothetical protein
MQNTEEIPVDLQRMIVYHYTEEDGAHSDILPSSQASVFQDGGGSSELFNQDSDTLYVPDLSQASSQSSVSVQQQERNKTKLWLVTQSAILSLFRSVGLFTYVRN